MSAAPAVITPRLGRRERILSMLKSVAHDVSGINPDTIDIYTTFLEMGVNSLLLIQFSQALQDRLGVEIPFRLLFEELATLDALSAFVEQELPPEAFPAETAPPESGYTTSQPQLSLQPAVVVPPGAQSTGVWNGTEQNSLSGTAIERIMAQQLQIMSQQLEVLRRSPAAPPRPPLAAPGTRSPERLGPFRAITRGAMDGLSSRQQEHLNALIARYSRRMRESKRLTQAYRPFLADTRAIVGFRLPWKELVCPIIAPRALGARVWDVDGNEYIDLTMGFGVNLFGHAPAFITAALEEQLRQGIHIGPQSPLAGQVAQLISELTGMERVTFCNTGSEAVMTALRLARTATRRTKFAVFAGSYHGNFDEVLFRSQVVDGELRAVPVAPGIPAHLLKDVLVLEYNRPESLDILQAHAHELAAVLVEPVQSSRLDVQPRAFLYELRRLTAEAGIALIFDEMISGFRLHPGGAQAWFGVQADLSTYGKVIGGGMPLGVVAGKATYMDAIDGGMWSYGDASYPQAMLTFFAGTFCKHPLAMAAAWAALNHLKSNSPALQQQLNQRTAQLVETLQTHFTQAQVPMRLEHFGSMFRFVFARGVQCPDLFYFHLLEKGIHLWEGRACFLSTAHTETDVAEVIRIVQESVAEMQEGGFFPASSSAPAHAATSSPTAVYTVPLTDGQKDIWILSQRGDDASRASNLPTTLRLRGPFNAIAMQQALQVLVHRHEALRTTFRADGESQRIWPAMTIACPLVDLSDVDRNVREAQVTQCITTDAQRVFDLVQGPLLLRVHIAKVGEYDHLLALTMHHIIMDGRSFGLFMKELKALYAAACQGIPWQLPPARPFGAYAIQQAQQQHAPQTRVAEAYWLGQFHHPIPLLELPTDRPRPLVQTFAGARQEMQMGTSLQQALKNLSTQHGCTLFITLLAGFQVLLHRLTGQDDIVVGIAAAEPAGASGNNLVGYTTNLLPLRSRINKTLTFAEHLIAVKQMVFDAYHHQSYSLIQLIEKLNLQQDLSRPPLISTLFNMDYAGAELVLHGLEVEMFSHPSGAVECDTFWNITDADSGLFVECYSNTDLFDGQTIRRWLGHYQAVLAGLITNPCQRLINVVI